MYHEKLEEMGKGGRCPRNQDRCADGGRRDRCQCADLGCQLAYRCIGGCTGGYPVRADIGRGTAGV